MSKKKIYSVTVDVRARGVVDVRASSEKEAKEVARMNLHLSLEKDRDFDGVTWLEWPHHVEVK